MSIRYKLALTFLLISVLPFLFVGYWSYFHAQDYLEESARNKLETVVELKVDKIEAFFKERLGNVDVARTDHLLTRELPILKQGYSNKSKEYIKAVKHIDLHLLPFQKAYNYHDVLILDEIGVVLYSSNRVHKQNEVGNKLVSYEKNIINKAKEGTCFTNIYQDMHMTAKVASRNGAKWPVSRSEATLAFLS